MMTRSFLDLAETRSKTPSPSKHSQDQHKEIDLYEGLGYCSRHFWPAQGCCHLTPYCYEHLQKMAHFQNRLMHVYWKFDCEAVNGFLQDQLQDLSNFC